MMLPACAFSFASCCIMYLTVRMLNVVICLCIIFRLLLHNVFCHKGVECCLFVYHYLIVWFH